ncbi:hypothetical protein D9757_000750 [Collybiopsis confluens]|uniref:Threonine aspartase n=1 Tax=Collybiopsis confluens TaxID=2823264 RepID=A0A8H5I1P7_9AGAR|nr:hypothetical protein D9757_000750 [Collybiopsis confluens]
MHTFVAVHGGAGFHSSSSEKEIKKALRLACKKALDSSLSGSSLDVVETAITVLEDDPNFNAGFSSNLTLDGSVECDAAIMNGRNHFGSVGAISGAKNPIRVARAILDYSQKPDPLGRVPPLTLVSSGARQFASQNLRSNSGIVDSDSMISKKAQEQWQYWRDKLLSSEAENVGSAQMNEGNSLYDSQDTVGAVVSCSGDMTAGRVFVAVVVCCSKFRADAERCGSSTLCFQSSSSTTIRSKAAMFGAGCWAQNSCSGQMGMACSISGTGEFITRSGLARTLAKAFQTSVVTGDLEIDPHAIMEKIIIDEFWKMSQGLGEPSPSAGILLMTHDDGDENEVVARVWCAFTTPSMAIAYASSKDPNPKAESHSSTTEST